MSGHAAAAAASAHEPAGAGGAGRSPAADIGSAAAPGEPSAAQAGRPLRAVRVTAVFTAAKIQVAQARYFAEAMLAGWPVADDTVFVVSEFAANAVAHSASGDGGHFWVHLETVPGEYVWVEVRDQGGPWVHREHADERPHGLEIVAQLATDFGVDGDARNGWIVWARLDLPKPSAAAEAEPEVAGYAQPSAGQPEPAANGHVRQPGRAVIPPGPPLGGLAGSGSSRQRL